MYWQFVVYDDAGKYCVVSDDRQKYRILAKESPEEALRELADRIEEDRD